MEILILNNTTMENDLNDLNMYFKDENINSFIFNDINKFNSVISSLKKEERKLIILHSENINKNQIILKEITENKNLFIFVLSSNNDKNYQINLFKERISDFIYRKNFTTVEKEEKIESLYEIIYLRSKNITNPRFTTAIENEYIIVDSVNESVFHKKTKTELQIKGKKFEVLFHLMRHENKIVSREQLLDAIWDEPELVTPNVVDIIISSLRKTFNSVGCHKTLLSTIRRRGFVFNSKDLSIYEKKKEIEPKKILDNTGVKILLKTKKSKRQLFLEKLNNLKITESDFLELQKLSN